MSIKQVSAKVTLIVMVFTVLGFGSPQANAIVSTNYQKVSQRTSAVSSFESASLSGSHSVSGDGRYVVFKSASDDLVSGDTNSNVDIFVRDTIVGSTSRVSVSTGGIQANAQSDRAAISYDGRFIVFESAADNIAPGVTGTSRYHIYIRDTKTNTTSLVDTDTNGNAVNGRSLYPDVSADGRFVVYSSMATNIVTGYAGPSNVFQVYIKDMLTGAVKLLSSTTAGIPGHDYSYQPSISCDGNVVAFSSKASNLGVPSGVSGRHDLIIVGLGWSGVSQVNVTSGFASGIHPPDPTDVHVSCDGNKILFTSSATDIVSPSTPAGYSNIYQHNRLDGSNKQVSLGNGDLQADRSGQLTSSMSGDGRYVAFSSFAHNVDTSYPNGPNTNLSGNSAYVRDTKTGATHLVGVLTSGDRSAWGGRPVISPDGTSVAFVHNTPGTYNLLRSLVGGFATGHSAQVNDVYKTQTGF